MLGSVQQNYAADVCQVAVNTNTVSNVAAKKPRSDGQLSGLAGELFVAAELLKRGLQVEPSHTYAFVSLNKPGQAVQYFIVPGADLHSEPARFSKWFMDSKMPGVHPKLLAELGYENAWHVFGPVAN